jgi:hypothetical protein
MLNNTTCLDMHPIDILERIRINCGLSSYDDMQWANNLEQCTSDCRQSNPQAASLIDKYKNTTFVNACDGSPIQINWSQIELQLCFGCQNEGSSSNGYNVESVEKMLEMHTRGKVVFQMEDMPPGCPYFQCILNKIKKGTIYQPFLNLSNHNIGTFHGIRIKFGIVNAPGQAWLAGFSNKGSDGYYRIALNSSNCNNFPNNVPLYVYENLVHELYHGIIASRLEKMGWNGNNSTKDFYIESLITLDGFSGQATNEHEYILLKYLDEWVDLIHSMNDGKLERDLYLGLVLNGFGDNEVFIETKLGITKVWIEEKINELLNLITAPNNENVSHRFNCN